MAVDYIKIFLTKTDPEFFNDFIGWIFADYGMYSEDLNRPEQGDATYSWRSTDVVLAVSNYYGEGTIRRNYDVVTFSRNF